MMTLIFLATSRGGNSTFGSVFLMAVGVIMVLFPGIFVSWSDMQAEWRGYQPIKGEPSLFRSKITYRLSGAVAIAAGFLFWAA
jgi:hypothetical protein